LACHEAPSGGWRQTITIPGDEAQMALPGNDSRVTLGALSQAVWLF
jgi:hypothetical protein